MNKYDIIFGVFTLLIAAIVWACLSKIDVVITSSRNIQLVGNLNVVESYANGSVKSMATPHISYNQT